VPILGGEQSLLGLDLRFEHPDFGLKSHFIPPAHGWPKWLILVARWATIGFAKGTKHLCRINRPIRQNTKFSAGYGPL
jgi:hypothetical protein